MRNINGHFWKIAYASGDLCLIFRQFRSDLNKTAVTPELLGEVMVMYAALPPVERIFEARAKRVIALLRDRGHGANCGLLAMAITIRLMALDAILKDHAVQSWTLPGGGPEVTYVHSYLLKVAAEAPLVEGPNGQPIFDGTGFQRRVLRIAGTRGHA
jgi:hypothetical protein